MTATTMGGSSENNLSFSVASNFQEQPRMWGVKNMSQIQRTALSDINHNVMGAINYRSMVTKKDVSGTLVLQKDSSKQQPCLQEINKKSTGSKSGSLEKKYEDENDGGAVPMFVKHTEAMLDEIDSMEVDMEESEEPIIDIDGGNLKDPLAVVEYVDDIYASYRKLESSSCISPDYMNHQFDINEKMRAILIDWLIEVHYKFELMDETLFLTVNLIDRFLERHKVIRKKLQLVGVTAMLLACKYEEVSVPIVDDFVHITDKAYTREEVLNMETLMVNKLQYNMSVPTPYVFMRRYLKAAGFDRKHELLSSFVIELCLVEYEMLKYPPSLLAAAAIYTAQCSLYQFKQWSKTCEFYTKYSEDQLLKCSRLMVKFHQKAGAGKLNGVHRKYNTSQFGYAAKAEPARFLL